jgi:hypothetical protein
MGPAMVAGIADRLWSMEDTVALIDTWAEAQKRLATYRKQRAV